MANMSFIRYHPLQGMDSGSIKALPPSLDKKDIGNFPLWLEEIVPGAFRLRSAEDIPGNDLKDTGLGCPNCGRRCLRAFPAMSKIPTCAQCR